jgi:hypothetical protein
MSPYNATLYSEVREVAEVIAEAYGPHGAIGFLHASLSQAILLLPKKDADMFVEMLRRNADDAKKKVAKRLDK